MPTHAADDDGFFVDVERRDKPNCDTISSKPRVKNGGDNPKRRGPADDEETAQRKQLPPPKRAAATPFLRRRASSTRSFETGATSDMIKTATFARRQGDYRETYRQRLRSILDESGFSNESMAKN